MSMRFYAVKPYFLTEGEHGYTLIPAWGLPTRNRGRSLVLLASLVRESLGPRFLWRGPKRALTCKITPTGKGGSPSLI